MIEVFTKSLGYLSVNASNMKYKDHAKLVYEFEDAEVNKHWINFYSVYMNGYKKGCTDKLNDISIHCMKELENV